MKNTKMASKPHLPVSRVNTIMKSCAGVETVGNESSQMMTKATECFIRLLAQQGYKVTDKGKKLDYKHLADVVHNEDKYNFLKEIMPKKITVAEYKKILQKKEAAENGHSKDSSSEESSSDEDSGSEDNSSSSSSTKE